MMRFVGCALGVLAALGQAPSAPDATRVLADMRQAIGGDAAIGAVHAFSVTGSESRSIKGGPTSSAGIEWICELPDRFVQVRRAATPWGDTANGAGFNGDVRIRWRDSDIPEPPDPHADDTPDQKADREKSVVRNLKHEFSRFAIAMIGIPEVDPLDASYDAPQTVDGKRYEVLALRSTGGYEARLFVDTVSHLPFAIAWMDAPIVVVKTTTSATVAVPRGRSPGGFVPPPPPPPVLPSGDPAAGLPKVLHQLRFEDFKTEDGLTWPHRFVEKVGDHVWTTTKVGRYKINPKIDPKKFATR